MGRETRAGLWDIPQEPELSDLLRSEERSVALSLRVAVPAQVKAYDPVSRTCTVEVGFRQVVVDPKDATSTKNIVQPAVTLRNIPVIFPSSGMGGVTYPLDNGDTGLLVVADRSLLRWLAGDGRSVDPEFAWAHNLQDSVFCPGLFVDSKVPTPPPSNTATTIHAQNEILLGQNAQLKLINEQLISVLDAFANAAPVANDGGAAIQTAFKTAYNLVKDTMVTAKTKAE